MKHINLLVLALVFCYSSFSQTSTLQRPHDPMVLTGADLPGFQV